jgi:hypothetical protein
VSDLWIPGASGPLDDLVARIRLRIQAFTERTGAPPVVAIELRDGTTATLRDIEGEPGFGFVALSPHGDDGAEEEWIVPVGAVARFVLRRAEEREPFGFTPPAR